MFDAKRFKLFLLLAICCALVNGPVTHSFGQEEPGGFRNAMNRFLGVRSKPAAEQEQQADDDEAPEPTVEAPPVRPEPPAPSPNTRSPHNVRPASGSKGLFSGGLFHQLRSVTNGDDEAPVGDDVHGPSVTQPPASGQPAVEPFSKPALPPSAVYGKSATIGSKSVGSSVAPTRTARANSDLPKIVQPNDYLTPKPTTQNPTAQTRSAAPGAVSASQTPANSSDLGVSDINKQHDPLNARGSSRRARPNGSQVVGLSEKPRTEAESEVSKPLAAEETSADLHVKSKSQQEEALAFDEAPSVSRVPVDQAAPKRPEFVITGRQTQVAQLPSTPVAERGSANAALPQAQLPDPISLPPASSSATTRSSIPPTPAQTTSTTVTRSTIPPAAPSSIASPTSQSGSSIPVAQSIPSASIPTTSIPSASKQTATQSTPSAPPRTASVPPASAPAFAPENFRSPLKDLASQSAPKPATQTPAKGNSVPTSSATSPGNEMPTSLYSQTPKPNAGAQVPKIAQSNTAPSASIPPTANTAPNVAATKSPPSNGALMEMSIPELHLWVEGPEKMRVDRPAAYRVFAKNKGQAGVVGLLVSALVPAGVTSKDLKVSAGTIEQEKLADASQSILWQLPELPPGEVRELSMELAAAKPENFGLDLEWTVLPQSDVVKLQSIQPQLLIGLEGPSEAMYGKPEVYKLHIRNPGNAPVEEVDVSLTADSFGTKETKVGTIASGDEKTIEVELTFKQAGELSIVAGASSVATGLTAKSDIKVNVAQVKLESACQIPERQYQGAFAKYTFSVENVGDVAAQKSVCEVALPPDTVVAELPEGVRVVNNALVWEMGALQPHSENTISVDLQLNALGEQPLAMHVKNDHGDNSECQAMVTVESISDLKLTVVDPVAPAPVSENVKYELVIHNRGARPARDVAVIAQFSDGIEPISVSAENAEMVPGQVVFQPIAEIGAGEKVTLVITANASVSGMHRFRAEVQCDGGETHLVQEESTRYLSTAARTDSSTLKR